MTAAERKAMDAEITKKHKDYDSANLTDKTNAYIAETEYFADYMGKALTADPNSINRIVRQNKSLALRVYEWIKNAVKTLTGKGDTKSDNYKYLRGLEKLYADALKNAQGGVSITVLEAMNREEANENKNDNNDFSRGYHKDGELIRWSIKEYTPNKKTLQANREKLPNMKYVAILKGTEFAQSEISLFNQVKEFFDKIDNNVYNKDLGDIALNDNSINDDLRHGYGRLKAIAFASVPQVLENGAIIEFAENHKNRNYDTAVIAAPVIIAGQRKYVACVVMRNTDTKRNNVFQRFYLHEVFINEKTSALFKSVSSFLQTERSNAEVILNDIIRTPGENSNKNLEKKENKNGNSDSNNIPNSDVNNRGDSVFGMRQRQDTAEKTVKDSRDDIIYSLTESGDKGDNNDNGRERNGSGSNGMGNENGRSRQHLFGADTQRQKNRQDNRAEWTEREISHFLKTAPTERITIDGYGVNRIPQRNLSSYLIELQNENKQLGIDTTFAKGNYAFDSRTHNNLGLSIGRKYNVLFLDKIFARSKDLYTFGQTINHERMHVLRGKYPQWYNDFVRSVKNFFQNQSEYIKTVIDKTERWAKHYGQNVTFDMLEEEFMAEIFGNSEDMSLSNSFNEFRDELVDKAKYEIAQKAGIKDGLRYSLSSNDKLKSPNLIVQNKALRDENRALNKEIEILQENIEFDRDKKANKVIARRITENDIKNEKLMAENI